MAGYSPTRCGATLTYLHRVPLDVSEPDPENDARPRALATAADLSAFVGGRERALVMFETEGCGKCQAMGPVLDGIARTTDAAVATMNPRDDPALIDDYDVRSVPKLLLFEGGELVGTRADGFLGVEEVRAFLASPADSRA